MKRFFLFVILLVGFCACNKDSYLSQGTCYKVYKIKTNNEFYEIYAKQGRQHFKIVSQKDSVNNEGVKIKQGGCYRFQLKSDYEIFKKTFGVEIIPNHRVEVKYYAENLKGLYLVK